MRLRPSPEWQVLSRRLSADVHLNELRDRTAAHWAWLALFCERVGAVSARELVAAGYGNMRLGAHKADRARGATA